MPKTARDTATDAADFGMAEQHSADRKAWELLISGPEDAERSVLLLPGGANAARSYDLVMADPALSGVRQVATTLPGMAGAPVTDEVSIPEMAHRAGEMAKDNACDVVVGFCGWRDELVGRELGGGFVVLGGATDVLGPGRLPDPARYQFCGGSPRHSPTVTARKPLAKTRPMSNGV